MLLSTNVTLSSSCHDNGADVKYLCLSMPLSDTEAPQQCYAAAQCTVNLLQRRDFNSGYTQISMMVAVLGHSHTCSRAGLLATTLVLAAGE